MKPVPQDGFCPTGVNGWTKIPTSTDSCILNLTLNVNLKGPPPFSFFYIGKQLVLW